MKKLFFILFPILILLTVQCKKSTPEDQLPPITTTGANTFGCKVNGNVWLPGHATWSISWDGPKENKLVVDENIQNYGMNGTQIFANYFQSNATTALDLDLRGINNTGTYHLEYYRIAYFDMNTAYGPFDTFAIVNISRCDTIQKIVSGTFSFIGYTDSTRTKSVTITDGRFDVHYPLTLYY